MNLTFVYDLIIESSLTIYQDSYISVGRNLIIEPDASLNFRLTLNETSPTQTQGDPALKVGGCVEIDGPVNVRLDTPVSGPVSIPLWIDSQSCNDGLDLKVDVVGPSRCGDSGIPQAQRRDSVLMMALDLGGLCTIAAHALTPLWSLLVVVLILLTVLRM